MTNSDEQEILHFLRCNALLLKVGMKERDLGLGGKTRNFDDCFVVFSLELLEEE